MISREDIIKMLRTNLDGLSTEFGVSKIGIFGSFALGTPTPESDLDIIVEFKRPVGIRFMDLADHLQNLFNRPVDIVTPAGIAGIRNKEIADTIRNSVIYV